MRRAPGVFNPLPCGMRLRRSEESAKFLKMQSSGENKPGWGDEIALMFAGQYVDQARQLLADRLAKIARLKSQGKETTEAESMLRSVEAFLVVLQRHIRLLMREQRPDEHGNKRPRLRQDIKFLRHPQCRLAELRRSRP